MRRLNYYLFALAFGALPLTASAANVEVGRGGVTLDFTDLVNGNKGGRYVISRSDSRLGHYKTIATTASTVYTDKKARKNPYNP